MLVVWCVVSVTSIGVAGSLKEIKMLAKQGQPCTSVLLVNARSKLIIDTATQSSTTLLPYNGCEHDTEPSDTYSICDRAQIDPVVHVMKLCD